MKPNAFLLAVPALAGAMFLAAVPAGAAEPALELHQGQIFSDPVGSVMNVSVTNGTQATLESAVVNCDFTAGSKPAGSASVTLYNIVAGTKGDGQVHLMGVKADTATCAITSTTPPQ
ncbi:hypothetical protein [Ancylobacter mangrovi]|uniref:hypothetical protein n=1 Tax=Ancylobacter mangrovi TaxID=2972472 RepID=UPI0021628243|nr:hypothetical protein [Ancylobacter mangrovi]MCS0502966.1 hypothetical protein [Ancylobacter mangrovi]